MPRLLITGGSGFVGTHLIAELQNSSSPILVLDNLSNSSMNNMNVLLSYFSGNLTFVEGNACNQETLGKVFEQFEPEIVIHLAGFKFNNFLNANPIRLYKENIESAVAVLQTMQKYNTKKILFSSSASVYGENTVSKNTEEEICGPLTPYAKSKYYIEQIIKDWNYSTPKSSAILLRYFNPIGCHSSITIGDEPKLDNKNAIAIFSDCALGKTKNVSVFGDNYNTPDGTCIRDYVHIEDVAKGHLKAIELLQHNVGLEIINLGTGEGTSVFQLIKALETVSNKKIPFEIKGRRQGEISYSVANPGKAKRLLNWQAENSLEQMCEDSWRWFSTRNSMGD